MAGPGTFIIPSPVSGGGAPSGAAGGDLQGTYPNPTVQWPHNFPTPDTHANRPLANAVAAGTIFAETDTLKIFRSDGAAWTQVAVNSSSSAPTGAAGGDLAGTYPNPTVAWNNGILAPDVVANRPAAAAGNLGKLFFTTDTLKIYRSNGTTWDQVGVNSASATVTDLFTLRAGTIITGDLNAFTSTAVIGGANAGRFVRVTIPKTGVLHDFSIFPTITSGNVCVGVFDTGDTTTAVRTKLYGSGSVACPAANAWGVVADPALSVTQGQQVDLVLGCDNVTASFASGAALTAAAMAQLPANFLPTTNSSLPKLCGTIATAFPIPATIAEATMVAATRYLAFALRIV